MSVICEPVVWLQRVDESLGRRKYLHRNGLAISGSRKRRHAEVEPVQALDEAATEGPLDTPAPAVGDETAEFPADAAAGDEEVTRAPACSSPPLRHDDYPAHRSPLWRTQKARLNCILRAKQRGAVLPSHGMGIVSSLRSGISPRGTTTRPCLAVLRHERVVHRGERPLACEHCEKTFAYKADLVIHERSHTGERPFACEVEGCSHAYAYKSTLVVHMRSHTGERPYACTVEGCSKAFVRPSKLGRHVREVHNGCVVGGTAARNIARTFCPAHSKRLNPPPGPPQTLPSDLLLRSEKPYVCLEEGCGEAFVRRAKLQQHELAVHGGGGAGVAVPAAGAGGPPAAEPETKKAFACDVVGCGASFVRRAGLNVHTSKVHAVV